MEYSILFGSESAKQTLLYIENYESGYCASIAKNFEVSASMIQKQLDKFEEAGVLVGLEIGRVRMYEFNPRYPLKGELKALLRGILNLLTIDETKKYFRKRSRPRRKGKPL
jgi:predicted transcriptional regulator